ncbi:MAG TPA: LacI family DNA-binding transcriptional regulator [Bacteroidota bacterium]|nr:LacI family DNA-binding transcriptional regulator [Bacteroidota bacterium]
MKQTTIFDVAKKLGVSASTVSRALSNHPDIKDETKARVRKAATELQYFPNTIALSLKRSQTKTIGVIVPLIKNDFFSSAISGIEQVANRAGYTILLCQSNEDYETEVVNANLLMHHRVAGLIVSIAQNTKSSEHFQSFLNRKIPIVFFDRACDDIEASKVIIDDRKGAFDAVNHLIERGYKKIAHFAGPQHLAISDRRLKGYLDALELHRLPRPNGDVQHGGLEEQDGYQAMDVLLKGGEMPQALFAVNDPVAIGAFQRIREAGLRIPKDIAVIGFGNTRISSLLDPPFSTVNQPSVEMGRTSAHTLIDTIHHKVTGPKTLVMDTQLIIRQST